MENQALNSLTNPIDSIEFALKGLSLRSKAIAGNIANINTPNYKRKVVHFEEILQAQKRETSEVEIEATNDLHILPNETTSQSPSIQTDNTSFHINGNGVDLDREMVELGKTGLRFKALTNLARKQFENIKGIIRG